MGISTYQISDNFESLQKHDDFTHKIAAQIFQSFCTVAVPETMDNWANPAKSTVCEETISRRHEMLLKSYEASLYERNNFSY
jgi:hypothetical protein